MKVIVPMAGRGSRFAKTGLLTPKPLIPVMGRPMIAWALQSLQGVSYSEIYFIALVEHERKYGITSLLHNLVGQNAKVVLLDDVTEGQVCTVLAVHDEIDNDEDVLIASSDTFVVSRLDQDIAHRAADCHGIISVARVPGDQWSFARTDEEGRVVEVAEKTRISDYASTGLYYFTSGREFVSMAASMIRNGESTCGEFYVIPIYQEYIDRGWRVDVSIAEEMWDMGTPASLSEFHKDYLRNES